VADFNGDGKLDLAVANSGDNTITLLLGDGRGGFTPSMGSPFAAGTQPASVAVGDFNGDGKLDLAVANSGGGVAVLLNTEPTSYSILINLVKRDESDRIVAGIMVSTLQQAQEAANKGGAPAANLLLKVFIDEVSWAESANLLTAANAAILIQEAKELMT
jgi:hypothetical protein